MSNKGRPGSLDSGRDARTRAVRGAYLSGGIGKSASILMGIASVAIVIRTIGAQPYGLVATVTGLITILGFLDFGLGNALIRKLSIAHSTRDYKTADRQLWATFYFLLSVAALISIATVALVIVIPRNALPSSTDVSVQEIRASVLVFGISVALAGPTSVGMKAALGLQRGRENNFIATATSTVVLLLNLLGLSFSLNVVYFVAAALIPPVLSNAIQTSRYLRKSRHSLTLAAFYRDRAELAELIKEGLPFTVLVVSGAISYQTDLLVVTYIAGLAAAASYGLVARMFSSITVLLGGGIQQMWASTAHALAVGDLAWVQSTFKRTLGLSATAYMVLSIAFIFIGPSLASVWSAGRITVPVPLMIAFAAWNTYAFVMSQLSTLLNGANRVLPQAIAAATMALVNLPLSIFLTSVWGNPGPLWASLIAHSICVGIPTVVMVRQLLTTPHAAPPATSS